LQLFIIPSIRSFTNFNIQINGLFASRNSFLSLTTKKTRWTCYVKSCINPLSSKPDVAGPPNKTHFHDTYAIGLQQICPGRKKVASSHNAKNTKRMLGTGVLKKKILLSIHVRASPNRTRLFSNQLKIYKIKAIKKNH